MGVAIVDGAEVVIPNNVFVGGVAKRLRKTGGTAKVDAVGLRTGATAGGLLVFVLGASAIAVSIGWFKSLSGSIEGVLIVLEVDPAKAIGLAVAVMVFRLI